MTQLVPLVMFTWPLVVLALFAWFQPRRAVLIAFLAGWMFLPMGAPATWTFPGVPDYDKFTATSAAVLLGAMLFDAQRLMRFRPRWFDVPMMVWLLVPIASTVVNDPWGSLPRALYGGLTLTVDHLVVWALPYFLGRIYFSDPQGLRELAIGLFIGGLIYIPLCLYEVRFSPQLHRMLYGYHHRGWDAVRFGGFRPKVFMDTGLQVGLWMTITFVTGFWLWLTGALKRLWDVPMALLVVALLFAAVLCKSAGALALLMAAVGVLLALKWFHLRLALVALLCIAPTYMVLRTTNLWTGDGVVALIEDNVNRSRAASLEGRFENENMLTDRALQQPLLGWSGWGRMRVYDAHGDSRTTPDGMWVIAFGRYGVVGLVAMTTVLLLPLGLILARFPTRALARAEVAPLLALAIVATLFMLDCLLNAMVSPVYLLAVGGGTSVAATVRVVSPAQVAPAGSPATVPQT
ncbi:MAG: O-antigen ligase domain-containing protein [Phycisphaeraceae bacterium]